MQLNPQQQAVVDTISGPCLVIAGAGSGKTRVIINKIKNLIKNGVPDHGIYAVTFTNKAAVEMRERLRKEMRDRNRVHISTFHTLGLEIIKAEHKSFNLKQKVILSDTHDQNVLLRDLIINSELENSLDEELEQVKSFISKAKNDLLIPQQMPKNPLDFSNNPNFINHYKHYCTIYHRYFTYMQSISLLDFDDLILLPTILLTYQEDIRRKYQRKIRYLLVDEYQDTNTSQYELVKLLVGENANFTVVGDDDQSIYSWRGAQPENLNKLQHDFPNLQVFFLEQNYRSTETILHAANVLIDNNAHIYKKSLRSVHGKGDKIKVFGYANAESEARAVVREIQRHKMDNDNKFGQYAVLYRNNFQVRLLEKYFMKEEIPIAINGDSSFFDHPEVKDIVAYLRFISNVEDDKALMRIINVPRREIGVATTVAIGEVAKDHNCSFFDACQHPDLMDKVRGRAYTKLHEFLDQVLDVHDQVFDTNDYSSLEYFINNLNYEHFLFEQTDNAKAVEAQMENIKTLMSWVKRWMAPEDEGGEGMDLTGVCQRIFLREMYSMKNKESADELVQLMTIHASKGLEFPYVHIVGCEEETIPHKTSIEDGNIEEERRLMYVGITRAQKELSLHYSITKRREGEEIGIEPSRFLDEMPQDILEHFEFDEEEHQKELEEIKKENINDILASLGFED